MEISSISVAFLENLKILAEWTFFYTLSFCKGETFSRRGSFNEHETYQNLGFKVIDDFSTLKQSKRSSLTLVIIFEKFKKNWLSLLVVMIWSQCYQTQVRFLCASKAATRNGFFSVKLKLLKSIKPPSFFLQNTSLFRPRFLSIPRLSRFETYLNWILSSNGLKFENL